VGAARNFPIKGTALISFAEHGAVRDRVRSIEMGSDCAREILGLGSASDEDDVRKVGWDEQCFGSQDFRSLGSDE
jgi:hypothetical protein